MVIKKPPNKNISFNKKNIPSYLIPAYSKGWENDEITFSFYDKNTKGTYYGSEKPSAVSEKIKERSRFIFKDLERFIDRDFVEIKDTNDADETANIRIMVSSSPSYAYAYYPHKYSARGGDIHLNPRYVERGGINSFSTGNHGYSTLEHEIGHALNLKHPHEKSLNETNILPRENDNITNTLMSYALSYGSAVTYMPFDIIALQEIYGKREYAIENNIYKFSKVNQYKNNNKYDTFQDLNNERYIRNIYDSGGTDTIDLSDIVWDQKGITIDIRENGYIINENTFLKNGVIDYTSRILGTKISFDTEIENIILSDANDLIVLNDSKNIISNIKGSDTLWGATNEDTINFEENNIKMIEKGNDLLVKIENTENNILIKNYKKNSPKIISNKIILEPIKINKILGNSLDNLLNGNELKDIIRGKKGNDTLKGGLNDDTLYGGSGDDILYGNEGNDKLIDRYGVNILFGNEGNDTLIGNNNSTLDAGEGNDVILVNGKNVKIKSGSGNDFISVNLTEKQFNNKNNPIEILDYNEGDLIELNIIKEPLFYESEVEFSSLYTQLIFENNFVMNIDSKNDINQLIILPDYLVSQDVVQVNYL
jgi:hypothetical protein